MQHAFKLDLKWVFSIIEIPYTTVSVLLHTFQVAKKHIYGCGTVTICIHQFNAISVWHAQIISLEE